MTRNADEKDGRKCRETPLCEGTGEVVPAPRMDQDNTLTIPGPRARRLILAALRVWELKHGISR